jgi:hypothetical protein
MKLNKITVGNEGTLIENALQEADRFVRDAGIEGKKALHVNLLAEEVLGMIRAIVGDYSARFWMECDKNECRICVDAVADVDSKKKKELLSVSKSGKNVANKGLMAKIGAFFENCMNNYEEVMEYTEPYDSYGYLYASGCPAHSMMTSEYTVWALSNYRMTVNEDKNSKEEAEDAWDELEKSIIANIADDVIIGVKDNRVTLTAVKKL